jgi:hypothetical protein
MRRRLTALIAVTALVLVGLNFAPTPRASALGNVKVTLNCSDGTSFTMIVDTDTLDGLVAAVQGMIDYPTGLSCSLIQTPVLTMFGHVAVAATSNSFIVAGGRWLVPCALLPGFQTEIPTGEVAHHSVRPTFARLMPAAASTPCPDDPTAECVWVNIGANVHPTDGTTNLEGTVSITVPEGQSCGGTELATSHLTSHPGDVWSCLRIADRRALTTTQITEVFGPAFSNLAAGGPVHYAWQDVGNPSTFTDAVRDRLQGPPAPQNPTNICEDNPASISPPDFLLQHGNISIYGTYPPPS